jgi:hypothetical protein
MENILRHAPSLPRLIQCFAENPPIPLLPSLGDPAWKRVAANPIASPWVESIRNRALAELTEPLPVLTDELYADFHQTGNRLRFERLYFERRRRLARAAIAALTESNETAQQSFLNSTLAKARDIFAEISWSLPAHVQNLSGKDAMRIDLFAAETANLCGEILNLFSAVLPEPLTSTVKHRLREQIFQNYLDNPPHWTTLAMNWNAVCHQGVLGAALAISDDPELLAHLFMNARQPLRIFLDGFSPDGGSSEGPGYWGYGFGWMAELNRQLEARTRSSLSLFDDDPHVRAIATFGPRMTLSHGWAVNFSDSSAGAAPRPALLDYLAERFDDPFIRSHAALAWQQAASRPVDLDAQRADLFFWSRQLLRCPKILGPAVNLPETDIHLADLGVVVSRFRDAKNHLWEFACKAGHNAEHHNHNDLGSYLLHIDGHRLLIEIGAPEYNKLFFSSKRYDSIAARSLGHPVPLVNHQEQPAGQEFHASLTCRELTPTTAVIAVDLTSAYPASAGCAQCSRLFQIDKRAGQLSITDTLDLDPLDAVETALITQDAVTIHDDSAIIAGPSASLLITPTADTQIKEVQTHAYSDHDGHPVKVHRIVLVPRTLTPRVMIGCDVRLL